MSTSNFMKATGSNMMRSSLHETAKSTQSKKSKIDIVSNHSLASKLHNLNYNATTLAATSANQIMNDSTNPPSRFVSKTSRNLYDKNDKNVTVNDSMFMTTSYEKH